MKDSERRFAVLIDADNTSPKFIKRIMDETAACGIATYRRGYGDWTTGRLNSWKNILVDFSITPIQQYAYTSGKNSTDSAMIIDAMDILYKENVEGFCLVSSDSDFTRLAVRLREAGMEVIGMGKRETPKSFVNACSQFKYLDLISSVDNEDNGTSAEIEESTDKTMAEQMHATMEEQTDSVAESPNESSDGLKKLRAEIKRILDESSDDDGWMFAGTLKVQLQKADPSFDSRNYGCTKFIDLLSLLHLRIEKRANPNAPENSFAIYVRFQ